MTETALEVATQSFHARIVERPQAVVRGDELYAAAAANDKVLILEDASPFNPTIGGYARIRYSANSAGPVDDVVVAYTGWDGDDEDVPYDTLRLVAPLAAAVPVGTKVDVWSPAANGGAGGPSVVYEVLVLDEAADADSRPVTAIIDTTRVDTITADTLPGRGESVTVGTLPGSDDLLVLVKHGGDLRRDGTFLDPETVPVPEDVVRQATEPPASSPTPEVLPFPGGSIYVRFDTVDAATAYRLHVSTSNVAAPSAATLIADEATSPAVVRTLADGSPFPTNPDAPEQPMVYVAVQATNGVAPDPAPSAWVGARPGQVDPAYLQLLVGTLIAERLFGETVEGVDFIGSRFTGGTLRTAEDGQRVQVTSDAVGRVAFYSGSTYETGPGMVTSRVIEDYSTALFDDVQVITEVDSPRITSGGSTWQSFLRLFAFRGRKQNSTDTIQGSSALLQAQTDISLRAPFVLVDGVLGGYFGILDVDVLGEGSVGDGGFRDSVRQAARSDALARSAGFRGGADQSIPASTWTQLNLGGQEDHSSSRITRSGSTITVLDAGLYAISCQVRWINNTTGTQRLAVVESFTGSTALGSGSQLVRAESDQGITTVSGYTEVLLPAGTQLRLIAQHNATSAITLTTNIPHQLNVRRIG